MKYEQSLCFELGIKTKINCRTPETKLRRFMILILRHSVADPDPGSGGFLTPGSGIRKRSFPDPGSRNPDPGCSLFFILKNLMTLDFTVPDPDPWLIADTDPLLSLKKAWPVLNRPVAEFKTVFRILIRFQSRWFSVSSVDPEPDSESGSWLRMIKMTHRNRNKLTKFHALKCWMFSFEAEGFFCKLYVLYWRRDWQSKFIRKCFPEMTFQDQIDKLQFFLFQKY